MSVEIQFLQWSHPHIEVVIAIVRLEVLVALGQIHPRGCDMSAGGNLPSVALAQTFLVRRWRRGSRQALAESDVRSSLHLGSLLREHHRDVMLTPASVIIPATLHCYLSRPPFRISVKWSPPPGLAFYYPDLSHSATRPTVSFLSITTPHLPWKIRLAAQALSPFPSASYHHAPLPYFTVQDVLNGIHMSLRKYVTLEEYESLAQDREYRAEVMAAYRRRRRQETGGKPGAQEGMRRVDWLAGRTVFEGLEESSEGEGVWKLTLGWS